MILGFRYEGMEEIIESGDYQIKVMQLRIPINLFALSVDSKKAKDSNEATDSNEAKESKKQDLKEKV